MATFSANRNWATLLLAYAFFSIVYGTTNKTPPQETPATSDKDDDPTNNHDGVFTQMLDWLASKYEKENFTDFTKIGGIGKTAPTEDLATELDRESVVQVADNILEIENTIFDKKVSDLMNGQKMKDAIGTFNSMGISDVLGQSSYGQAINGNEVYTNAYQLNKYMKDHPNDPLTIGDAYINATGKANLFDSVSNINDWKETAIALNREKNKQLDEWRPSIEHKIQYVKYYDGGTLKSALCETDDHQFFRYKNSVAVRANVRFSSDEYKKSDSNNSKPNTGRRAIHKHDQNRPFDKVIKYTNSFKANNPTLGYNDFYTMKVINEGSGPSISPNAISISHKMVVSDSKLWKDRPKLHSLFVKRIPTSVLQMFQKTTPYDQCVGSFVQAIYMEQYGISAVSYIHIQTSLDSYDFLKRIRLGILFGLQLFRLLEKLHDRGFLHNGLRPEDIAFRTQDAEFIVPDKPTGVICLNHNTKYTYELPSEKGVSSNAGPPQCSETLQKLPDIVLLNYENANFFPDATKFGANVNMDPPMDFSKIERDELEFMPPWTLMGERDSRRGDLYMLFETIFRIIATKDEKFALQDFFSSATTVDHLIDLKMNGNLFTRTILNKEATEACLKNASKGTEYNMKTCFSPGSRKSNRTPRNLICALFDTMGDNTVTDNCVEVMEHLQGALNLVRDIDHPDARPNYSLIEAKLTAALQAFEG